MPEYKFYAFTKILHVRQEKHALCWAACLLSLTRGLELNHPLGKEICQLVSSYTYFKEIGNFEFDSETILESCCENGMSTCNIDLKRDHFLNVFKGAKLICTPINDPKKNLKDMRFIIETLKKKDTPILIETAIGSPHLELITGYGNRNGCEYFLRSNPLDVKATYSIVSDGFIESIRNAWTIEIEEDNEHPFLEKRLTEDHLMEKLEQSYMEALLKGAVRSIDFDKIDVLQFNSPSFIPQLIDQGIYTFQTLRLDLLEEFMEEPEGPRSCTKPFIYRDAGMTILPIETIQIMEQMYTGAKTLEIDLIDHSFLREYGTNVKVRYDENLSKQYLIESMPSNYVAPQDWTPEKEFLEELEKNPKVKFFNQ